MAELSRRDAVRIALRSYALQTLLNLKTLQGSGYLFTLWPLLKKRPDREQAVRAAAGYLNSHPIFAAFAQGAMLNRIEAGETQNLDAFSNWRESLAGPLGLIGDRLIWDRYKPLLFSLAVIPIVLLPTLTTWCAVALTTLLLYNLPLYKLRLYALSEGYKLGERVLSTLGNPRYQTIRNALDRWAWITAGLVAGTGLAATSGSGWFYPVQFVLAFLLTLLLIRMRFSIYLTLLLTLLLTLGLPAVILP